MPIPDESVPVELIGGGTPSIHITGRNPLVFPENADGRRIEWVTPEVAAQLSRDPYTRAGLPKRFVVAEDLQPQNLNIEQRVIEACRRHTALLAALLAPELAKIAKETNPGLVPYVVQKPSLREEPQTEFADLDKPGLVEFARTHDVDIDARWNEEKIRSQILLHEKTGT